ncbi:MAG: hypothetical protein Fur0037_00790 [Planctomycetota bacterium]
MGPYPVGPYPDECHSLDLRMLRALSALSITNRQSWNSPPNSVSKDAAIATRTPNVSMRVARTSGSADLGGFGKRKPREVQGFRSLFRGD